MSRTIPIAAAVLVVLALPAPAQEVVEHIGRWPFAGLLDIAIDGSLAYLTGPDALYVVDISDPRSLRFVGAAGSELGHIRDMAMGDGVVFTADSSGVVTVDVTDPTRPREERWQYPYYHASPTRLAISGSYLYLLEYDEHIRVVDVSSPTRPLDLGSLWVPGQGLTDLVIAGHHLYAVGYELRVFDISLPATPVQVGMLDTGTRYGDGLAVSGGYAYVVGHGLKVVDTSNPAEPVEVAAVDPELDSEAVAVSGGIAYVTDGFNLRVYDVSTPSQPVEVSVLDTTGWPDGVAVSGSHVFIAGGMFGVVAVDVSTPSQPVEVATLETVGRSELVAASSGYAYLASPDLEVFDVRVPSSPILLATVEVPGGEYDLAAAGDLVFVAGGYDLHVFDVSTPSSPVLVGSHEPDGGVHSVALRGRRAYLGGQQLSVVDVSDPAHPVQVGACCMRPSPPEYGLAVQGNYAYRTRGDELQVIDVGSPWSPALVATLELPSSADEIVVSGSRAYLTGYHETVVVDISDPLSPELTSQIPGYDRSIAFSGNIAYVTLLGIRAFDVSDPASPVELGFGVHPPDIIFDLAAADGYLYAADWEFGLEVFRDIAWIFADSLESGDTSGWTATVR